MDILEFKDEKIGLHLRISQLHGMYFLTQYEGQNPYFQGGWKNINSLKAAVRKYYGTGIKWKKIEE